MAKRKISDEGKKALAENLKLARATKQAYKEAKIELEELGELSSYYNQYRKSIEETTIASERFKKMLGGQNQTLKALDKTNRKLQESDAKQAKLIDNVVDAYREQVKGAASLTVQLKKGKISRLEYSNQLQELSDNTLQAADSINLMDKELKPLRETLEGMIATAKKQKAAAEEVADSFEGMHDTLDQIGRVGIPILGEVTEAIKVMGDKTRDTKLAFAALGAAVGAMAFSAVFAKQQIELNNWIEKQKLPIEEEIEARKRELAREGGPVDIGNGEMVDSGLRGQWAAEIKHEKTLAKIQFEAAAKTARYGGSIGDVGMDIGNLQRAGFSAERIASAMASANVEFGQPVSANFAANMEIMSERTGQSSETIAALVDGMMMLDDVSAETAMNMTAGLKAMSDSAGVDLNVVMQDIADSSESSLAYSIASTKELAKQVTFARSMGVSFSKISQAGENMVLNYRDSIRAEMQLSSLLGEQVDLSEVRQQFAMGNTDEAIKALQAQGLDPGDMDLFQRQALMEATGMDLDTLNKLANKTGKTGDDLAAVSAKDQNADFVDKFLKATDNMTIQNAFAENLYLDEQGKIQMANIMKELGDDMINTKKAELHRVDMLEGFTSNLISGLGGLVGGLIGYRAGGGSFGLPGFGSKGSPATTAVEAMTPAGGGIGKAAGGGIGGALRSLSGGLASLANPATLIGLAAITIALKVLEPVIASLVPVMVKLAEVMGTVFVAAIQQVAPIITSVFEGIGFVIEKAGQGISSVILSIANALTLMGSVDGANLFLVAGAVGVLSGALAAFGAGGAVAGIGKAIGEFFGGSITDNLSEYADLAGPISIAAVSISQLANSMKQLSEVDTENLEVLRDIDWEEMSDAKLDLGKGSKNPLTELAKKLDELIKIETDIRDRGAPSFYLDGKQISVSYSKYNDDMKAQRGNISG